MRRSLPLVVAVALAASGCWTHRVGVPSPVANAGPDSLPVTTWAFLWRSNEVRPSPECMSETLQEVTVRANWGYSLIRAATLGLVAPASFDRRCAAPLIDPPAGGRVPSHGATHVSTLWGRFLTLSPAVGCDARPMARLALRPNPFFDILAAATAGAIAPVRVRAYCADIPDDTPATEREQ
jgi:hypothetical protein